jgi:hypothetical protein
MESFDYKEERNKSEATPRTVVHSKIIRAGKRTYFFDVKSTRNNEYYLTITESKKKFDDQGSYHYEKHKMFLYPEDFDKFTSTLHEIIEYIDKTNSETLPDEPSGDNKAVIPAEKRAEQEEEDQEQITADTEAKIRKDALDNLSFEDI